MADGVDRGDLGRVAQEHRPSRHGRAVGMEGIDVAVVGPRHQVQAWMAGVEPAHGGVGAEGVVHGVDVVPHRVGPEGVAGRGRRLAGRVGRPLGVGVDGEAGEGMAGVVPDVEGALGVGHGHVQPTRAGEVGHRGRPQQHRGVDGGWHLTGREGVGPRGREGDGVGVHGPARGLGAVGLEGVYETVSVRHDQLVDAIAVDVGERR